MDISQAPEELLMAPGKPPPPSLPAHRSLVTQDPDQPGSSTMNIVTFACPVSIKPDKHYALGG
jgi:hypothetical protein